MADRIKGEGITRVWQKWRFSTPQTHLWLIKVWFSASTFVVKIATFAKPETGFEKKASGKKMVAGFTALGAGVVGSVVAFITIIVVSFSFY